MKSPDETKKGLECCCNEDDCSSECPYFRNCDGDGFALERDALALIQQLESDKQQLEGMLAHMNQLRDAAAGRALKMEDRVRQLEAERDAMKEALGLMVYQYCVSGTELDHRYMCAGETAFRVLGLEQYGDTRILESWLFPECQDKEE